MYNTIDFYFKNVSGFFWKEVLNTYRMLDQQPLHEQLHHQVCILGMWHADIFLLFVWFFISLNIFIEMQNGKDCPVNKKSNCNKGNCYQSRWITFSVSLHWSRSICSSSDTAEKSWQTDKVPNMIKLQRDKNIAESKKLAKYKRHSLPWPVTDENVCFLYNLSHIPIFRA